MDNATLMQFGALALAALAVASLVFTFAYPYLSGEKQTAKRVKGVTESRVAINARRVAVEQGAQRKQAVADTLKTLEEQQKKSKKVNLRIRLRRAGLEISERTFWLMSVVSGVVSAAVLWFMVPSANVASLVIVGFIGTLGLPRWFVGFLTKRRQKKFLTELPNAIDVIVRGVKSGLPPNECLGIIARESAEPLKSEFQEVIDEQRVGVPLGDCFERMVARLPLPEVKFFAIVIAIQQSAGGNLSEALSNLSGVLRSRKQLAAKVGALSAEAKASAAVLALLPPLVFILVYMSTPGYMEPLWTTTVGKFMVGGSAVWMICGCLVMKKMISFKY